MKSQADSLGKSSPTKGSSSVMETSSVSQSLGVGLARHLNVSTIHNNSNNIGNIGGGGGSSNYDDDVNNDYENENEDNYNDEDDKNGETYDEQDQDQDDMSKLVSNNYQSAPIATMGYTALDKHPPLAMSAALSPEVKSNISYMLQYSFSKAFNVNLVWTSLIYYSWNFIVHYFATKPRDKIENQKCLMRNVIKYLSPIVGQNLTAINRKKEELLSFEATVVLAFMKTDYCSNLTVEMDKFLENYPQFKSESIDDAERARLLEFSNCVLVVQLLIPAKNNKEHLLDLVSRLTEGYSVRRITGTGMTLETRNRYDIIHHEAGIVPQSRVEKRKIDVINNESKEDEGEESQSQEKKKEKVGKSKVEVTTEGLVDPLTSASAVSPRTTPKSNRGRPRSTRTEETMTHPVHQGHGNSVDTHHVVNGQLMTEDNMRLLMLLHAHGGAAGGATGEDISINY